MTTCREPGLGTSRSSGAGVSIRNRRTARGLSLRLFRRRSYRRSSESPGSWKVHATSGEFVALAPRPCRIVIRVGRFFRRPKFFRDVAQIHADARPRGRSAAHGIDKDVVDSQISGRFGMAVFPTFQSCESGVFVGGIGDYPQRHFCALCLRWNGAGTGGSDAFSFAFHLAEMRGPWGIAQSFGFIASGEVEEFVEGPRRGVHVFMRVSDFREAFGYGEDREIGGIAVGNFVPVERAGDARIGQRADGISGAGGPVFGVLVVVEEDAMAFLFPPFRTGDPRGAALDGS